MGDAAASGEGTSLINALDRRRGGARAAAYGEPVDLHLRRFTYPASACIFLNTIVGPGIVSLPKIYQRVGWFIPSICLIVGSVMTAIATLIWCDLVASIPGNETFARNIKFCDPFDYYIGRRAYVAAHVFFYCSATSVIMSSIAPVAEASDIALSAVFGTTYGVSFDYSTGIPAFQRWRFLECEIKQPCEPFYTGSGDKFQHAFLITFGYVLTTLLLLPWCYLNLDEGMPLQWLSLLTMAVTVGVMIYSSATEPLTGTPIVTENFDTYMKVPGTVAFNQMYGIFLCAWLIEKHPGVDVPKLIWPTTSIATGIFVIFGIVCSLVERDLSYNIITDFTQRGRGTVLFVSALAFEWVVLASGVPVVAVTLRRNLEKAKLGGVQDFAAFLGCIAPFLLAWIFYRSNALGHLITYSGLFFVGWLLLVAPYFVQLCAYNPLPAEPSFRTMGAWFASHWVVSESLLHHATVRPIPHWALHPKYHRPLYAFLLVLSASALLLTALFTFSPSASR
ncbi:hypothetical protein M885DRAFT_588192 [Pelagophyceae sp. CCMP2097]|nr:hypothetical protein M885DRAFT_588192 [Pelagophyceae sp. CCMP2097]